MLRTLRGFLPWIAFAVVNAVSDWRVGAIVAVALSVLLLVDNGRTGHGLDEAVIESSAAVFFVVIALIAFAAPKSALQHHTGALAAAWLAVTAWGSIAIRKPFTLGIARRAVPEQFWHNPLFLRANMLIASAWAGSFTASAIIQVIIDATVTNSGTANTIVQVACYVLPALFTIRYQAARRRAAATNRATN
ncbi:MAG TPA: hypothetical protein VH333_01370 [Pseudonocardiaceae bacterium]|jgi:hypothetical protein|nr:hypothetical protein [Pseudonocardiaceae bacterium]